MDTSARQQGFEIRVFPLLGELPKAIEPHLPACQLYRWQLGPNMWSSPTTKSLDSIVLPTLGWASQGKATDPPQVDSPAIVRSQRRGQRRRQGIRPIMVTVRQITRRLPEQSHSSNHLSVSSVFTKKGSNVF